MKRPKAARSLCPLIMHISHLPETLTLWPSRSPRTGPLGPDAVSLMASRPAGRGFASRSDADNGDQESRTSRSPKVLVVDDNAINRRVLAGMVRAQGCEVEMAGNGQDALDKLSACADYQLIFMDCEMPGMDGFEATRQIRARWGAQIPIVAASAYSSDQDQKRCLDCGMNDFMSKPLKRPAVRGVLEKWIPGVFDQSAA